MSKIKTKHEILAGIDVGSYSTKMKIAEVDPEGGINTLESLRKIVNLGKDTFNTGLIRHEHVEDICDILKGFKKLISEYDADRYRIVATSALREADNRDYILDYIYMKTGFRINIISESEERFFTYNAIVDKLKDFSRLKQEGVLIVDIGSGGVEITLFNEGSLVFTQHIKTGSLRLKEVLSDLERKTLNFPNLIGEFIESETDALNIFLKQNAIKNFLGTGSEIRIMHYLLERNRKEYDRSYINKDAFYRIYHQIIGKSSQQIMEHYKLDPENVETLVPAMMVYEKFLSLTQSDRLYTPTVSLCDGLIRHMVDKKYDIENKVLSDKDIISSVKKLGERFFYDNKHANQVEKVTLQLFDQLKRLHGYSKRERLLLQIAAILHDVGKYINVKSHNMLSHDIIMNSEILGLSKKDMLVTANIVKYHSLNMPSVEDPSYASLACDDRIMISKLAAFLKIADSLDKSHKQKITGLKITFNDRSLTLKAEASQDALLEEWEFENKSTLFTEVYGLEPNLIINRK